VAEHVQGMPILVAHGDADWVVPVELVWYSASARSMRSIQARARNMRARRAHARCCVDIALHAL
jgi:hypothetical protein